VHALPSGFTIVLSIPGYARARKRRNTDRIRRARFTAGVRIASALAKPYDRRGPPIVSLRRSRTVAIATPGRLPQLDAVAFAIEDPGEAPSGIFTAFRNDLHAAGDQNGKQRFKIVDAEVHHGLLFIRAEVGRVEVERRPNRIYVRIGIFQLREALIVWNAKMALIPGAERLRIACPEENTADTSNTSHPA
jgi:hypothetical protein